MYHKKTYHLFSVNLLSDLNLLNAPDLKISIGSLNVRYWDPNVEQSSLKNDYYGQITNWWLAGKRKFGIYSDPDHPGEYVFCTMGVDRAWNLIFEWGNDAIGGFESADSLWASLQNGMIQFIQNHSGAAAFYSNHNTIARPKWAEVDDYLRGIIKDFLELKRRLGC